MEDRNEFVIDALKADLAYRIHNAWCKYTELFGEPPHGTLKQMQAMVEFMRLEQLVDAIANSAPKAKNEG